MPTENVIRNIGRAKLQGPCFPVVRRRIPPSKIPAKPMVIRFPELKTFLNLRQVMEPTIIASALKAKK